MASQTRLVTPISQRQAAITHLINGLYTGGAEMMLYKLLSGMDRERFSAQVITLIDGGELQEKVENLGIKVYSLGMKPGSVSVAGIRRLIHYLRQNPPDLIQTWMYHSDLIGGSVGKLITNAPIVWNLRTSDIVRQTGSKLTTLTIKACALLSAFVPQRIVSCSEIACQMHAELGYDKGKLLPIPNGVELSKFQPDDSARTSLREELNLASTTPLVGMVARFHPQKDHANFVQAAAHLHPLMPDVHFVLCGDDVTWENQQLAGWIAAAKLEQRVHLLGRRKDTPRINAALDVATLSSAYGEGFPNVLVEAMACGTPCVATDSGDSALIMQDTGIAVPTRNAQALAAGWQALLPRSPAAKQQLRQAARQRVEAEYSLPSVVARYEKLYSDLLGQE